MTVGAILYSRGMFPEKRAAPFRMAQVTGLINARLFELGRIRGPVRVVTVGAGQLAFFKRHMGRAHQLCSSLEVARATELSLSPRIEERSLVSDLGELEAVGSLFHDSMAIDAGDAAARMGAPLPVSLSAAPMAARSSSRSSGP